MNEALVEELAVRTIGLAGKQGGGANLGYELASEAVPAALSRDSSEEYYGEGEGDHNPMESR